MVAVSSDVSLVRTWSFYSPPDAAAINSMVWAGNGMAQRYGRSRVVLWAMGAAAARSPLTGRTTTASAAALAVLL